MNLKHFYDVYIVRTVPTWMACRWRKESKRIVATVENAETVTNECEEKSAA